MAYVAGWRMNVASRMLRDTDASLVEIGLRVGYQDVAAFSRAFKKIAVLCTTALILAIASLVLISEELKKAHLPHLTEY